MNTQRRALLVVAAAAPVQGIWPVLAEEDPPVSNDRLVLSSFEGNKDFVVPGSRWRGFSDRVMGGVSDADLSRATVAGKPCLRLTGRVTRDSGGGFIQMALDLGTRDADFNASGYAGIELLVRGNDEDYNIHVRTADCGWYDESYRATFRAKPEWQQLRFAWTDFEANGVAVPLDAAHVQRIALLGWMREFTADLALAEMALYRSPRAI